MAFNPASTNRVGLALLEESTFGEFPTGDLEEIAYTQESLSQQTDTTTSNTIRSDRQVPDVIRTGISAQGGFNNEIRYGLLSMEKAWKGVLGAASDFTSPPSQQGPGTIQANASNNEFETDSDATSIDFSTYSPGDWVRTSGFNNEANNGYFQITSVDTSTSTAHKIVVEGASLVDESGDGDETIQGSSALRNGTSEHSFSFAKQFNDLGLEARVLGYRFGSATFNLNPQSIATLQFQGQGVQVADTAGTDLTDSSATLDFTSLSTINAAVTNEIMSTTGGIADFIINRSSPIAATPQSLSLNPQTALRQQNALNSGLGPAGIGVGRFTVGGSLSAYFEDKNLLQEHLLYNDVDLAVAVKDGAGNAYLIDLPAIRLGGNGTPQSQGNDQDVITSFDVQAKRSTRANQDYMFAIHKFAAPSS